LSCGIYRIENKVNNKVYIGQSVDIEHRKRWHFNALRRGKHWNKHLQNAWNKYGMEKFDFTIIETCSTSQLDDKEIYWISHYNSMDSGYNESVGGRHTEFSDNTKSKISIACSKDKNGFYGKHHTGESKKIMSAIKKEQYIGEKHPRSTITTEIALEIIRLLKQNKYTTQQVADIVGTSYHVVKCIRSGDTWKHLSRESA